MKGMGWANGHGAKKKKEKKQKGRGGKERGSVAVADFNRGKWRKVKNGAGNSVVQDLDRNQKEGVRRKTSNAGKTTTGRKNLAYRER